MYTSDLIKNAVATGYKPGLITGKKLVRLYICHKCRCKTMVKFYMGKLKYNACKCGYRKRF